MTLQKLVNFNVDERNWLAKRWDKYVQIFVWTIDEPHQMEWLIHSGVDGIITNYPQLLSDKLAQIERLL